MARTRYCLNLAFVFVSISMSLGVVSCGHLAKLGPVVAKRQLNESISSPSGYTATAVSASGKEGMGHTVIRKGDDIVSLLPNVFPILFSPTEDILLVTEWIADDDARHYLLNIGKREFSKDGLNRLKYTFGGRYVSGASWSSDGKVITLHNSPGLSKTLQDKFSVADLL